MADQEASPGWDAIDAALEPIYKDQEPLHFGTMISYQLGGPDPLQGISVYSRSNPDHWHFVTYGFTELYEKESDDKEVSGYGFELTFRLTRVKTEKEPPQWTLSFLQNLARYVFQTGNAFGIGHHIPLNGPICLGSKTPIWAVVFGRDPELGELMSANGKAEFLQIVGTTMDELDLVKEWDAQAFLKEFARTNPLLLTDLERPSILADAAQAASYRARAEADGSSMVSTFVEQCRVLPGKPLVWEIGALGVDSLLRGLKGRLLHGRSYDVHAPELVVHLVPDATPGVDSRKDELTIRISPELAKEWLSSIKVQRGDYRSSRLSDLVVRVVPTDIKDQRGKVVEVVG